MMPPTAGKRPLVQSVPEPAPEPIQGTAIVIFHPGSQNLYIGRAADTYPHIVPHCIARLHNNPGQQHTYQDPWLIRPECLHSNAKIQQKTGLKLAEEAIRYRPTTSGAYRQPTAQKQLYHLNSTCVPEKLDIPSPFNWSSTQTEPEYLIGDKALYVNPEEPYNVHWPIRRGKLNLHTGVGGSLSAVLNDLEAIWSWSVESILDIPLKDLKHYRAVLLVPDLFVRAHVKGMLDILLNRLGFNAAFSCQESACAAFGSGVMSACVVDVGDQKTSVSCVEDGLSLKQTRLTMEYGGCDITRCFYWLLAKSGFVYKECDLNRRMDAVFLQEIKETHCHMDHDQSGIHDETIQIRHPGKLVVKYDIQMGDEVILAAMAIFYPDMFGLQGCDLWRVYRKQPGDPADQHDDEYLQQTQSRQEQAARAVAARRKANAETPSETNNPENMMDDSNLLDDDEGADQNDNMESTSGGGANTKKGRAEEEEGSIDLADTLIGIDQAILQSIDKCDSDDMKKRMYSCIVVVGGGVSLFRGAEGWIKYAVWTQMPPHFRLQLETMDVITNPKEFDPRFACWKGGCILSCLDTAQEMWIKPTEWNRFGVKVLRERGPYQW